MKKIFFLSSLLLLLNGCAQSIALLGSSIGGASNGKIIQSSLNSAVSYGVKAKTGKTPIGHALAYAEEKNPEKRKDTCISFIEKTRSEFCTVIKKQLTLTNVKIKEKTLAIVKKPTKTPSTAVKEKISISKQAVLVEEKSFIDILMKSKNTPRQLAIELQTRIKEKSKNNYLSQYLFRR